MSRTIKRAVRRSLYAIAVSLVGFGGSIANAALLGLAPNQTLDFTATPAVDTAGLPTGNLVFYEAPQTLVNNPGSSLSGTLTSWVYDDTPSSNTLDFVYLLTNTGAAGSDSFKELTLSPFSTFMTNVGYEQTGTDPTGADRVGHNTIDWYFSGSNTIGPGTSTDYLVIQTSATTYNFGSGEVIDDGSAKAVAEAPYATTTNMPEPASMTLAVLAGVLVLGRRRRI